MNQSIEIASFEIVREIEIQKSILCLLAAAAASEQSAPLASLRHLEDELAISLH